MRFRSTSACGASPRAGAGGGSGPVAAFPAGASPMSACCGALPARAPTTQLTHTAHMMMACPSGPTSHKVPGEACLLAEAWPPLRWTIQSLLAPAWAAQGPVSKALAGTGRARLLVSLWCRMTTGRGVRGTQRTNSEQQQASGNAYTARDHGTPSQSSGITQQTGTRGRHGGLKPLMLVGIGRRTRHRTREWGPGARSQVGPAGVTQMGMARQGGAGTGSRQLIRAHYQGGMGRVGLYLIVEASLLISRAPRPVQIAGSGPQP